MSSSAGGHQPNDADNLRIAQFSISPSSTLTRRDAAAAPQMVLAMSSNRMSRATELGEAESFGAVGGSPETLQLSQSIGEEVRLRFQRRNQFRLSRKTAISMDQCHVWGTMPALPMHSHSGSDTGLTASPLSTAVVATASSSTGAVGSHDCCAAHKRQSVTESPHLRVLHDSLTSLTSRITGSQESLPSGETATAAAAASAFFGKASRSRRKMKDSREKLAEQLRHLETNGLPRPLQDQNLQLNAVSLDLEPSWDRVVSQTSITSTKMLKQQAAIWELFQTEINILRHLRTIIEVYIAVIQHLQSNCNLLSEVSTDRLFPGLGQVYLAHRCLWTDYLRPALLAARRTGERIQPGQLAPGFLQFGDIFQPCADYCLQIGDAKEYLRGLEKSEAFGEFVKWAHRMSCRNYNAEDGTVDLQLKSLLTMPLQRITKYGLLLQEVLRHTDDCEERLQLETMIARTTDFCNRLNASYQLKSDQEEVRGVADRLEDAKMQEWREALGDEAASLLDRYRLDLTRPMPHNGQQRRKLCEGELRIRDEKGKWSEAKCLLFTDLLLLTKCGKRSNLRLLRPPIPLERLLIHRLQDSSAAAFLLVSLTDFASVDCVLYLAGPDQRASDDWVERLAAARASVQAQSLQPTRSSGGRCAWPLPAEGLSNLPDSQQQLLQRILHCTHSSSDIDALGRSVGGVGVGAAADSSGSGGAADMYTMRSSPSHSYNRLRSASQWNQ